MPRLRNSQTGAVVSTSEAIAARLGSEWVSADEPKRAAVKKTTTRRASSSKSEK